ncbi:hypothetical protein MY11210_009702, partial [Beauveria gryllotalpidicola]
MSNQASPPSFLSPDDEWQFYIDIALGILVMKLVWNTIDYKLYRLRRQELELMRKEQDAFKASITKSTANVQTVKTGLDQVQTQDNSGATAFGDSTNSLVTKASVKESTAYVQTVETGLDQLQTQDNSGATAFGYTTNSLVTKVEAVEVLANSALAKIAASTAEATCLKRSQAQFNECLARYKAGSMGRELRAIDATIERLTTQADEQGRAIKGQDRIIGEQRKLIDCLVADSQAPRSGNRQPRGASAESTASQPSQLQHCRRQ